MVVGGGRSTRVLEARVTLPNKTTSYTEELVSGERWVYDSLVGPTTETRVHCNRPHQGPPLRPETPVSGETD